MEDENQPESKRRRWLVALAVSLLLLLIWSGLRLRGTALVNDAIAEFERDVGSIAATRARYPDREENDSARRLHDVALRLGFGLGWHQDRRVERGLADHRHRRCEEGAALLEGLLYRYNK